MQRVFVTLVGRSMGHQHVCQLIASTLEGHGRKVSNADEMLALVRDLSQTDRINLQQAAELGGVMQRLVEARCWSEDYMRGLRDAGLAPDAERPATILKLGHLILGCGGGAVYWREEPLDLNSFESKLLEAVVRRAGQTVLPEELLAQMRDQFRFSTTRQNRKVVLRKRAAHIGATFRANDPDFTCFSHTEAGYRWYDPEAVATH